MLCFSGYLQVGIPRSTIDCYRTLANRDFILATSLSTNNLYLCSMTSIYTNHVTWYRSTVARLFSCKRARHSEQRKQALSHATGQLQGWDITQLLWARGWSLLSSPVTSELFLLSSSDHCAIRLRFLEQQPAEWYPIPSIQYLLLVVYYNINYSITC